MKKNTELDNLIDDLNKFYIELTGEGISRTFEAQLRESGCETILALIAEKKHAFTHALYRELESDDDMVALDAYMAGQPERCDDHNHYA